MNMTAQERLDYAHQHPGATAEELAEDLELTKKTAITYKQMVKIGVRVVREIDAEARYEATARIEAGETLRAVAIDYGYAPGALQYWLTEQKPEVITKVQRAIRTPFARFPEIFGEAKS